MPRVDVEGMLKDLALRIDRLKVLYEQHFVGVERLAPEVARQETERLLAFLGRQRIGNTARRFRYLSLLRRFKTFAERWDKIMREIENGTYYRHVRREELRRRQEERLAEMKAAATAKPKPSERANGAAPLVPGMTEGELRELHRKYVSTRRALGDAGANIEFETLVSKLSSQVPTILQRHSCEGVTFSVKIRGGKVVLKAAPKE